MKISIVMPAYNEEKRIGRTLEEYGRFFKKLRKKMDTEILVVINNTKDKTEEVVKKYMKKYKEIRYLNFKEGGKGFAIIEGFKDSLKRRPELVGFADADMATGPEAYYDLILNINGFDGIIASRNVNGSVINPVPPISRRIASRVFNFVVRVLFLLPYQDTQLGAKLFKREAIEKTLPEFKITQWAFDVNLLYSMKKQGLRIKEHKTNWGYQELSKIDLKKSSIQMFLSVLRLRIMQSRLSGLKRAIQPVSHWLWKTLR